MDLTQFVKRFFLFSPALCAGALIVSSLFIVNNLALAQRLVLKDAATPIAEQPSSQSRVIAVLAKGDTARVLKTAGPWVQVAFRGKQKGWMYLGRTNPATATKPPATMPSETPMPLATTPPIAEVKPSEQTAANGPPPAFPTSPDGGISFHLGSFSRQFTYVGKFYYRTLPQLYVEGTFQYVAGNVASNYLMYGNAKYVRPLSRRLDGTATAGVGVINSVPVRAAGVKSVSNMMFNYGIGVQRYLKNSNWLRADIREYTAIRNRQGLANFFEFTLGIAIGIRWSQL